MMTPDIAILLWITDIVGRTDWSEQKSRIEAAAVTYNLRTLMYGLTLLALLGLANTPATAADGLQEEMAALRAFVRANVDNSIRDGLLSRAPVPAVSAEGRAAELIELDLANLRAYGYLNPADGSAPNVKIISFRTADDVVARLNQLGEGADAARAMTHTVSAFNLPCLFQYSDDKEFLYSTLLIAVSAAQSESLMRRCLLDGMMLAIGLGPRFDVSANLVFDDQTRRVDTEYLRRLDECRPAALPAQFRLCMESNLPDD